jgi:hypothetical protein
MPHRTKQTQLIIFLQISYNSHQSSHRRKFLKLKVMQVTIRNDAYGT